MGKKPQFTKAWEKISGRERIAAFVLNITTLNVALKPFKTSLAPVYSIISAGFRDTKNIVGHTSNYSMHTEKNPQLFFVNCHRNKRWRESKFLSVFKNEA